jgi:uncharacterized protein with HEPN domain
VLPKEWKLRIEHMLDAASRIERFTAGMTLEQFEADDMVADAVIQNVQRIGEVARHVPPEITRRHPNIPWTLMTEMRNIIVHRYFGLSLRTV